MPYGKKTAYKKGCFKMTGPSLYKKMDPMYNGKPGVQKADFKQFAESPNKMYSESPMKKYKCKTPKKMMGKPGCSICAYGKRKCTCR